jgi:hypothetical protein
MSKPSSDWSTCIRIPDPSTSDTVPRLDPQWCAARGINPMSEVVLRMIKDDVSPLIRWLEKKHGLEGFHFLVHDRQSGVPTVEGDNAAYIHLRLFFKKPKSKLDLNPRCMFTRPNDERREPFAGLDMRIVKSQNISMGWELLNQQSAWVLRLIEAHEWTDGGDIVRQVQQFGHFFANMTQMTFR